MSKISAAHSYAPDETLGAYSALSGKFGVHAFDGRRTNFSANTNAAIAANATDQSGESTSADSLDLLAPQSLTWEDIVRSKLEAGLEGEAYNLLLTKLDGRDPDYVMEKLGEFVSEFAERGFLNSARDLNKIIHSLFADYAPTLSVDIDDMLAKGPSPSELSRICQALNAQREHIKAEIEEARYFITPPAPAPAPIGPMH